MANKKPVLVFSHGAWHSPEYMEPTMSPLREAGYTCEAVRLPSLGPDPESSSIPQNFDPDVAAIRKTILKHLDAGDDVILIVHSYSGVVGSEAVAGLDVASRSAAGHSTAVVHLVYVAALVLDLGGAMWPGGDPPYPYSEHMTIDGDIVRRVPELLGETMYNRCTPEQRALAEGCLQSHSRGVFVAPVTHTAWRVIPTTYVKATWDSMKDFMANRPPGHKFVEYVEVDGDHFPFVTAPEETAAAIKKAAEKYARRS